MTAARGHKGGARPTLLVGALSNSALSFTVTTGGGAGYPDGSTGNFVITFDTGLAGEEKVLCSARASDTFTVAASGRGYDDTTASSHANGATVTHTYSAIEAQEANDHIVKTTQDDHTQYAKRSQGLFANRPAAGRAGARYYATNTDQEFLDDGAAWHELLTTTTGLTPAAASAAYAPIGGLAFVGCRLTKSANQTLTSGANFNITWDVETFDTTAFHDNVTNNSRITIPAGKAGYYRVDVLLAWAAGATGFRDLLIRKNGAAGPVDVLGGGFGTGGTLQPLSTVLNLAVGDYLEVQGGQNSGGPLDVVGLSTGSFFGVQFLGT